MLFYTLKGTGDKQIKRMKIIYLGEYYLTALSTW